MTKADIVAILIERIGLQKAEAQTVVEMLIENVKEALLSGETVKISGFGTFTVRKKGSRIGRNPKTKQEVTITPRRVITFRASEQLKDLIEKPTT
ncbi:MAG: integration host factor subunit alpha [Thermodesulfovibrionales bacterium]|nr:integration host factor subunit alpha [Thermodesulfovibrionales bacterium]